MDQLLNLLQDFRPIEEINYKIFELGNGLRGMLFKIC